MPSFVRPLFSKIASYSPSCGTNYSAIYNAIIFALGFTVYLGGGLSYFKVRPYHVLIILITPLLLKSMFKQVRLLKSWPLISLICLLIFYVISLIWAQDTSLAFKYLFYLFNGYLIIFSAIFLVNSRQEFTSYIYGIFSAFVLNIIIGIGESLNLFRWFISRLSLHNSVFGVDDQYSKYLTILEDAKNSTPDLYNFMVTQPSGFNWGPNQYILSLSIIAPLFLFVIKNKIARTAVGLLLFYLTFMAASRVVVVGQLVCFSLLAISMFKRDRFLSKLSAAYVCLTLALIFTPLDNFNMNSERIGKFQSTTRVGTDFKNSSIDSECKQKSQTKDELATCLFQSLNIDWSVSKRAMMAEQALNEFSKTKGLGVGVGNSAQEAGLLFGKTQIHNFWLEVFVEVGFIGIIFFIFLYVSIYKNLFVLAIGNSELRTLSLILICTLTATFISGLAVGTLAYQTTYWVLLAISILVGLKSKKI